MAKDIYNKFSIMLADEIVLGRDAVTIEDFNAMLDEHNIDRHVLRDMTRKYIDTTYASMPDMAPKLFVEQQLKLWL